MENIWSFLILICTFLDIVQIKKGLILIKEKLSAAFENFDYNISNSYYIIKMIGE